MTDLNCDVAVIGAGTAGLAAERAARRAGASTLLIDPEFHGNTCTSVGCMPSKLLIAAGGAAHAARRADTFGIRLPEPEIDGVAVMDRVRRLRDTFVASVDESIAALPDEVAVKARARFAGPTTLTLDDGRAVAAKAIVIAVGSTPAVPETFAGFGERVLTNETVFELSDLPRSLGVIGAGPLGLELAQAFARLDVAVTVLDEGDALGGLTGDDAATLGAILAEEMTIRLGVGVKAAADPDGIRLSWTGREAGADTFDRVLVASGRPPAYDGLDLAVAGLELDDKGIPVHDRTTMRCGDSAVFVAGDASGERAVLHEASSEGAIAGRNAAQWPHTTPGRRTVPFAIMFTDPEVARIGNVDPDDAVVGLASYEDQGRARAMAVNQGFVRIFADFSGRVRGATLAAPAGEHLAHLLAWAIEEGHTAEKLLDLPFYHPTFEEGIKPALRDICATLSIDPPADRDEGTPGGA